MSLFTPLWESTHTGHYYRAVANQRDFTHIQKLTVFRRDLQTCQVRLKCDGVKVEWDDWHCDHKRAWSKGGYTTVDNGQVACLACNLIKVG